MSYITFNPNEVVYIRGIGYATLINCGSRNTISQKIEAQPIKKESIYFDPDLFNSDIDSNNSKKSQSKSDEQKTQAKPVEAVEPKKCEDESSVKMQNVQRKKEEETINIVQAKLEGSSAVIFTSEKNLTKTIFIAIKSLLINHKEQIIVQIEISKTIDTLRKAIFQQIGEQMSSYLNIKLFATNPLLAELSVHTKTIHQCLIKDNDKLILTADYAFGFKPIPATLSCKYKITLNNNTITSANKPEEPKPLPIPIPPPPLVLPVEGEPKVEAATVAKVEEAATEPKVEAATVANVEAKVEVQQPKAEEKVQEIKQSVPPPAIVPIIVPPIIPPALVPPPIQQKIVFQNQNYHARCNIQLKSGRKFWQFKIEKVPTDEADLFLGICTPSSKSILGDSLQGCSHVWSYYVISGKKNYTSHDIEGNILEDEQQNYGYAVRQNDTIGVLLTIKGRHASVYFYKNSISCGEAYSIDLAELDIQVLVPFVNIAGEAQVTLDSKASLPLDSFRKK